MIVNREASALDAAVGTTAAPPVADDSSKVQKKGHSLLSMYRRWLGGRS
ncbi:MAG: hypothetical protein OXF06_07785 [Bacteroidetes bacterium]|nr:hypothetical protein [Bacteroidota bacterium]